MLAPSILRCFPSQKSGDIWRVQPKSILGSDSSLPYPPPNSGFQAKETFPANPESQRPAENSLDDWTAKHNSPLYTICSAFPMSVAVSPYHTGHVDTDFGNKMLLRRLDLEFRYAFGVCYQVLNLFIKKINLWKTCIQQYLKKTSQLDSAKATLHHLKEVRT